MCNDIKITVTQPSGYRTFKRRLMDVLCLLRRTVIFINRLETLSIFTFHHIITWNPLGTHLEQSSLKEDCLSIPNLPIVYSFCSLGLSFLNNALKLADDKLFNTDYGMRTNVKKILVILTDGHENNPTFSDPPLKAIKDRGVEIISVAVGNNKTINRPRLEFYTGNTNNIYVVSSYENFAEKMESIAESICKSSGEFDCDVYI